MVESEGVGLVTFTSLFSFFPLKATQEFTRDDLAR